MFCWSLKSVKCSDDVSYDDIDMESLFINFGNDETTMVRAQTLVNYDRISNCNPFMIRFLLLLPPPPPFPWYFKLKKKKTLLS